MTIQNKIENEDDPRVPKIIKNPSSVPYNVKWPVVAGAADAAFTYIGPRCLLEAVRFLYSQVSFTSYNRRNPRIVVAATSIADSVEFHEKYGSISGYLSRLNYYLSCIRRGLPEADKKRLIRNLKKLDIESETVEKNGRKVQHQGAYSDVKDSVFLYPAMVATSLSNPQLSRKLVQVLEHELVHYDLGDNDLNKNFRKTMEEAFPGCTTFTDRHFDLDNQQITDHIESHSEISYVNGSREVRIPSFSVIDEAYDIAWQNMMDDVHEKHRRICGASKAFYKKNEYLGLFDFGELVARSIFPDIASPEDMVKLGCDIDIKSVKRVSGFIQSFLERYGSRDAITMSRNLMNEAYRRDINVFEFIDTFVV